MLLTLTITVILVHFIRKGKNQNKKKSGRLFARVDFDVSGVNIKVLTRNLFVLGSFTDVFNHKKSDVYLGYVYLGTYEFETEFNDRRYNLKQIHIYRGTVDLDSAWPAIIG